VQAVFRAGALRWAGFSVRPVGCHAWLFPLNFGV
jgi:hypothetical protein